MTAMTTQISNLCRIVSALVLATVATSGTVRAGSQLALYPDAEAMLAQAIAEGRAIPAEQAIASVRQFWGQADLPAVVDGFYDEGPVGRIGTSYRLRVDGTLFPGSYHVRAQDGLLISFYLHDMESEDDPVITAEQALAIAEQFVRAHYPAFEQYTWQLGPEKYRNHGSRYEISWSKVLNQYGTLAAHDLFVDVDAVTGAVISYATPPDRITGPTVPQITLSQAMALAASYAPYDPTVVPFIRPLLQMAEDAVGIQSPVWKMYQQPQPTAEEPAPIEYVIEVDAITGDVSVLGALGGQTPARLARRIRSQAIRKPAALLCDANGTRVPSVAPVIRNRRVWVRAETLRGVSARVEVGPQGVVVRDGTRKLAGSSVGATQEKDGCWLPLRRVADALGWRLLWQAKQREVWVQRPAVLSGAPRLP